MPVSTRSARDINPFAWPLLGLLTIYLFSRHNQKRPGRCRWLYISCSSGRGKQLLIILAMGCVGGLLLFEAYFALFRCRVSSGYMHGIIDVARRTVPVLKEQNVVFWADFATLLCILREEDYNTWDHDTDLSIMEPTAEEFERLTDALTAAGLGWELDDTGGLLQVWKAGARRGSGGPRMDIFVWKDDFDGQDELITTTDWTIFYRWRKKTEIFPLQSVDWLGMNVSIPRDSHSISAKEFDRFGGPGSYMKSLVFRRDCFHNFFRLRWWY